VLNVSIFVRGAERSLNGDVGVMAMLLVHLPRRRGATHDFKLSKAEII
jgi:hypothetical protein